MSPTLQERLAQRSLAGRYELFLGVGGGFTVLGLIFFLQALGSGRRAGLAALPRQLALLSGLAFGSVAFVAVQKITNAKWSGLIIGSARPLGLPACRWWHFCSLCTLGYTSRYGPMTAALPELKTREGGLATPSRSCSPGWPSASRC